MLEERAEELQKEAKYKESLDAYQDVLELNKNAFGVHSDEY